MLAIAMKDALVLAKSVGLSIQVARNSYRCCNGMNARTTEFAMNCDLRSAEVTVLETLVIIGAA